MRHTGTYVFDFQTQEKLYTDLHALEMAKTGALPAVTDGTPTTLPPTVAPTVTEAPSEVVAEVVASSKKRTKAKAK